MEDEAELVGPEAVVAQTVGDAGALEVLDPAFGRAAINVPVVEGRGRVGPCGDDEAGVGSLVQGFGLVDDASLPAPGLSLIGCLAHQADLLAGRGAPPSSRW